MTESKIVTFADLNITGSKYAGATIFWKLRDTTTRLKLDEALHNVGIDQEHRMLPAEPSPEKCLRRACKQLREYRRLIRPLKGKKGWALVSEKATEDNLSHETDVIVRYVPMGSEAGDISWEPTYEGKQRIGWTTLDEMEGKVREAFNEEFHVLNHGDMSAWLLRHVHCMNAVALRDGGGVYYIPGGYIAHWEKLSETLKLLGSSRAYSIESVKAENAVEAVFDALVDEAASMAGKVRGQMESEALGIRAMHTRIGTCESFLEKIKRYESFLDTNMDRIHEQVNDLKVELSAAILAADDDEDEDVASLIGVG